jgi:hypothetical protein
VGGVVAARVGGGRVLSFLTLDSLLAFILSGIMT